MGEVEPIGLTTICHGGVPEVFERELRAILANITDPNTDAEKTRKITITFTFKPHEDRSGAAVFFTCKAAVQPATVAKSQVFLSRHTGQLKAYGSDARQTALFGEAADAKTMAVVK